ncbi:transposase [Candidatus Margulisiibacteriota bacterium]
MTLYKNKYRIESCRLKSWDYSSPGYYFVTICTKHFEEPFGKIVDGRVVLYKVGKIANKYWQGIPKHFKNVSLDEFIVMPNHIHGIIIINIPYDPGFCRDVACNVSTDAQSNPSKFMSNISPDPRALGAIVRSFKSAVTNWCNKNGCGNFAWQSRYYDHLICDERSLYAIRNYINCNPANWAHDTPASPISPVET